MYSYPKENSICFVEKLKTHYCAITWRLLQKCSAIFSQAKTLFSSWKSNEDQNTFEILLKPVRRCLPESRPFLKLLFARTKHVSSTLLYSSRSRRNQIEDAKATRNALSCFVWFFDETRRRTIGFWIFFFCCYASYGTLRRQELTQKNRQVPWPSIAPCTILW